MICRFEAINSPFKMQNMRPCSRPTEPESSYILVRPTDDSNAHKNEEILILKISI
jgi:hypothetical protein